MCQKEAFVKDKIIKFEDLGLAEPILRAVRSEGYQIPTPIQAQAIAPVLAGRDLLGCAQTGTGKTAAFALPTLHRLSQKECRVNGRGRKIRALVLSPTRELASQIGDSFRAYGKHLSLRHTLVYGGVSQSPQVRALNGGVDVLVATPGRLLDLMNQGFVDLSKVEILILDEADRMLDMGFIPDLRRIVAKVPAVRQTLLFSATLPDDIRQLAAGWLRDPVSIRVAAASATADNVRQSVRYVEQRNKPHLLSYFLKNTATQRTLVFTRTKHGADKVVKHLMKSGIRAEAIHGNKSQSTRERALASFKSNKPPVLVATDIAARGLDIDEISHVVNFDLPMVAETYIHRIGRTARAGASGAAVSFCDRSERTHLRAIEKLTRQTIAVEGDQPQYPTREQPEISVSPRIVGNHQRSDAKPRRAGGSAQGVGDHSHMKNRTKKPFGQRRDGAATPQTATANHPKAAFGKGSRRRRRQASIVG